MKKIAALIFTLFLFISSFAQRRTYEKRSFDRGSYDSYMIKRDRFRTIGFVMLGGGVAAFVGGVALINSAENQQNSSYYYSDNSFTTKETVGVLLVSAGTIASLGSIPFFVIAGTMHRKAIRASAFLDMEKVPSSKWTGIPLQPFPALGMKINL